MRRIAVIVSVLVVVMMLTIGLAVPGIILHVQEVGEGLSDLVGPTSSGTICVPYEYYVEIYFNSLYLGSTTVSLNTITQVYPGNFSADLPAYTNVSTVVYYNSNTVSTGYHVLETALTAGDYTYVNITPAIDSTVALNGEFDVVLLPPSYYASSGQVNLEVQEIGLGTPTGAYTDLRVYLGEETSGWIVLEVYLDLRCYELSFYPPSLASAVVSLEELKTFSTGLAIFPLPPKTHSKTPKTHRTHIRSCPDPHLVSLIMKSPYYYHFPEAVEPIIQKITRKLSPNLSRLNEGNVTNWDLIANLTVPGANVTIPGKGSHG